MRLNIALLILMTTAMTGSKTFSQATNTVSDVITEYRYPVNYVKVDQDTQVAYVDEGEGSQTLLFIHGLATYLPSWYKNIDALKSKYRCVAIDLPGYGRSSKGNASISMNEYAMIVLKVIDQLGLKNVVLVGHSMGGQVAVTTVLKRLDQFDQLILLAPAGFERFSSEQATWLKTVFTVASVEDATEAQIRANWSLNFYSMPSDVIFMIQDRLKMIEAEDFNAYCQAVVGGMHAMLDEPIFDQLKNIKQRTLVVYGANDGLIPNKYLNPDLTTQAVGESGAGQMSNVTLKFIPECGHFISFDKPEETNEILHDFLSK